MRTESVDDKKYYFQRESVALFNDYKRSKSGRGGFDINDRKFLPITMDLHSKLEGHLGCINTCAFNPYGDKLITGCDDGCVWLWNLDDEVIKPTIKLRPHISNVFTTNFLTSNKFISGGNDSNVNVIEIREAGAVATVFLDHHIRKVPSSFVMDSNTFVTCSYDSTVRLFDVRQSYSSCVVKDLPFLDENDRDFIRYRINGYGALTEDLRVNGIMGQDKGGGYKQEHISCNETLLLDYSKQENILFSMRVYPNDTKSFAISGSDGCIRMFDLRNITNPDVTKIDHVGWSVYAGSRITGIAFNQSGDKIAGTVADDGIYIFNVSEAVPNPKASELSPARNGARIRDVFYNTANFDADYAEEEAYEEDTVNAYGTDVAWHSTTDVSDDYVDTHNNDNQASEQLVPSAEEGQSREVVHDSEGDNANQIQPDAPKNVQDQGCESKCETQNNEEQNTCEQEANEEQESSQTKVTTETQINTESQANVETHEDAENREAETGDDDYTEDIPYQAISENDVADEEDPATHGYLGSSFESSDYEAANRHDSGYEDHYEYVIRRSSLLGRPSEEDIAECKPRPCAVLSQHSNYCTIKGVNWFGNFVITGSDSGKLYFYDISTKKPVKVLHHHKECLNVVAVHPRRHLLATSGVDAYACLWTIKEFNPLDIESIERAASEAESRRMPCII